MSKTDDPMVVWVTDTLRRVASQQDAEVVCPVCWSTGVESSQDEAQIQAPLGPPVSYTKWTDTCTTCKEYGDFKCRNDVEIERAYAESRQRSLPDLLNVLTEQGYIFAYIERALALPQGTIKGWQEGDEFTAEAAALMRLVSVHPELLQVSEERFSLTKEPTPTVTRGE